MIKNECFLCEEEIFARDLCKRHYAIAYRLSKAKSSISLAVDLLVYRQAFEAVEARRSEEVGGGGLRPENS